MKNPFILTIFKLIMCIGLTISPVLLLGQVVLFNSTYDFTENTETSISSVPTLDGGSMTLCAYSSVDYDSTMLLKLDKYGCIEWHTIFRPYDLEGNIQTYKKSITQYPDSSYLALITFNNPVYPDNNTDLGLIKFSKDGEILWSNTYGGWPDRGESGQDVQVLPDRGAVIIGSSNQWINNNTIYERLGCIVKVDSLGQEEWSYLHDEVSIFRSVCINTEDNNIVILGSSSQEIESVSILMELSLDGNLINSSYAFPKTPYMQYNSSGDIILSSDGNYVLTGYELYNFEGYDILGGSESYYLCKVNKDFELIWLYISDPSFAQKCPFNVVELEGGKYIIGGLIDSLENGITQIGFLARFSATGDLLWEKTYTSPQDGVYFQYEHPIYSIEKTLDGNILTTGWTSQIIPGNPQINSKLWLMKVDGDGNFIAPLNTNISIESDYLCVGDSSPISIEVSSTTGCYSTTWSGNGSAFVVEDELGDFYFQATSPGIYDLFGNISDEGGHNNNIALEITVQESLSLPLGDTLMVAESLSIHQGEASDLSNWSGSASPYLSETNGALLFESPVLGTYELIFHEGCGDQQMMQIVVQEPTGVQGLSVSLVTVSPNPAQNWVEFRFPSLEKQSQLQLYNPLGQLVKKVNLPSSTTEHRLGLEGLPSGIYLWELGGESGKLLKK